MNEDFQHDVREGLSAPRKELPPRWFYDDLGSALFDAICFLPEYYVMRAEGEVLRTHRDAIVEAFGSNAQREPDHPTNVRLVELGSGAARKTRILLDAVTARQHEVEYVPVDVDGGMLARVAAELQHEYANLRVRPVTADFTRPSVALEQAGTSEARTIVLFLGSTIGNLDPDAAVAMLRDLRAALRPGDALFLGADLRKSKAVLEPAYDDPLGVTAAFNLNLLTRINRELGGHFDVTSFRHRAFYDEQLGRIEMHLVSTRKQVVRIDALDLDVAFEEGESIHTESSYKHDDATLDALAEGSGFTFHQRWTDAREWFADVLMFAR